MNITQLTPKAVRNEETETTIINDETPDGIGITLWINHDRDPWISTYPVAVNSSGSPFGPKKGKTFCLCLSRYSNDKDSIYDDFTDLVSGAKKLTDLTHRFHNGKRDEYALGLCESEGI